MAENHGSNDKQHVARKKGIPLPRVFIPSAIHSVTLRLRLPPAPEPPKQVLWALRGPSTLSVYRSAQRAGDSNYQQMTVAVLNADQMAIEGIAYVQLCGSKRGRGGGGRSQDQEKQKKNKTTKHKVTSNKADHNVSQC